MKTNYLRRRQQILLQVYRKAAQISDPDYRMLLEANAGTDTSTSNAWTNEAYDQVMASIEAFLFDRVHRGIIKNPIPASSYIRSEHYWRRKNPGSDLINSRQVDKIKRRWSELQPLLKQEQQTDAYFAGIVAQATGQPARRTGPLTHAEAGYVIDALTDRLKTAIRRVA